MKKKKEIRYLAAVLLCAILIHAPAVSAAVLTEPASVRTEAAAVLTDAAAARTEAAAALTEHAAVRTEAAAGQVSSASEKEQEQAGDSSKSRTVDGRGIWEKIREKLPEIDLAEFDADAEKEKLREAVRTMDELGISPEMLVRNAWDFLSRKENRQKIDRAVDDLRDKVEEVTGGDSAGD
jgi:hypothetical protein